MAGRLQYSNGHGFVDMRRDDNQPLPNSSMRNPKFISNGLVAKNVRINIAHNCCPAIFDPSQKQPEAPIPAHLRPVQEAKPQVTKEVATETFAQVKRYDADDAFADFGVIADDGDELDDAPINMVEAEAEPKEAEVKKSPFDRNFSTISEKQPEDFGINKDELAALLLTKRQVRAIYEGLTGKAPGNTDTGALKQEIRKVANSSFANFTRCVSEIERCHKMFPAVQR